MSLTYQLWSGEKHPQTNGQGTKYTTMEDSLKKAEKNLQNRMKKNK